MRHVDKSDFFGKGKLEELTQYIRRKRDISAVVLGVNMLSALQLATLQDLWKVAVYDRYERQTAIYLYITKTLANQPKAERCFGILGNLSL